MNTKEKCKFVTDLAASLTREMHMLICAGRIPAEWDGHELRVLMAEKFIVEAAYSVSRHGSLQKRGARYRAFRNTIRVNNL